MKNPQQRFLPIKGGEVFQLVWDNDQPSTGLTLHFAHANGFNAQTYSELLAPLQDHFRIIASDLRGHGRTRLPADPARHKGWNQYARDVARIVKADHAESGARYLLMGHSLGGAASLLATPSCKSMVNGLFLADPVIPPLGVSVPLGIAGLIKPVGIPNPLSRGAEGRRPHFRNADEAFASYHGRGAFKTWPDKMLEDYLAGGLVPDTGADNDHLKLACAPAWEAENFKRLPANIWLAVRKISCPVHILYAEKRSTCRRAVAGLRRFGRKLGTERLDGTTHFLPMEEPAEVRSRLLDFADTL